MEKIRTYDMPHLSRATRHFRDAKKEASYVGLILFERERMGKEKPYALELAQRMYETHKEWVDSKMQPLLPYLQREERNINSDESIGVQYKEGLSKAIGFLSLATGDTFDAQDAITAYTGSFLSMLRVCERFGVNPKSAVNLAQQSYSIDKNKVAELFQKNSDLPQMVVERAALRGRYPEEFLDEYRQKSDYVNQLVKDERYKNLPKDVIVRAVEKFEEPEQTLNYHLNGRPILERDRDASVESEVRQISGFHIDGVPILKQRHGNWCGYTSLSMVLQYYGYSELTPERIFRHINGEYDGILEYMDPGPGPGIDVLALTVQELTSLKPRVVDEKVYKKIKERNSYYETPQDVLNMYIEGNVPCIVRTPGHFMVATGVDVDNGIYSFNDPRLTSEKSMMAYNFEAAWSKKEENYPRDARHLMLAISKPKK